MLFTGMVLEMDKIHIIGLEMVILPALLFQGIYVSRGRSKVAAVAQQVVGGQVLVLVARKVGLDDHGLGEAEGAQALNGGVLLGRDLDLLAARRAAAAAAAAAAARRHGRVEQQVKVLPVLVQQLLTRKEKEEKGTKRNKLRTLPQLLSFSVSSMCWLTASFFPPSAPPRA